ncbi:hypothetical protein Cagg_2890 [Chloroflexus aggregans DSM 9485]|uniref:Uncharacterized protein n=1 Tax=Chloroflexus aggregans (strain MD-66 / DSM 9485) TaxID=326427 RepID=B8G618_CHLAD|nr:hypothetical protein Cagg_2890 [Chloroflexus aggregans DSM 9485]
MPNDAALTIAPYRLLCADNDTTTGESHDDDG